MNRQCFVVRGWWLCGLWVFLGVVGAVSGLASAQEKQGESPPGEPRRITSISEETIQGELVVPEHPAVPSTPETASVSTEVCKGKEVPQAFWRKAMEWVDSGKEAEGRLLLRDLHRDYPDSEFGRRAQDWLVTNKDLDHSGRVEFIVGATLAGAAFTYSLTAGILGRDDYLGSSDIKVALWASLGGAGLGLAGSWLGTMNHSVSDSQALLFSYSAYWGWWNGYLLYDLIWPLKWEDALLAGAVGMAAGMGTTLGLWRHMNVSEGAAQMTVSLSSYALEILLLTNFAIGGENTFSDNETVGLLTLLIPANLAAVGGYFLGQHLQWTAGDIRLISLGGILGNLLGFTLWATVEVNDFQSAMWIMNGSVVGGLALGTILVAPWRHAGNADGSKASASSALIHIGREEVLFQPPVPTVLPVRVDGQTGFSVEFPLLSLDW